MNALNRRSFLRSLGISAAALPFVAGLPSLASVTSGQKQRLVFIFSPNGTVPSNFWPGLAGYEHGTPVISRWNDACRSWHVDTKCSRRSSSHWNASKSRCSL